MLSKKVLLTIYLILLNLFSLTCCSEQLDTYFYSFDYEAHDGEKSLESVGDLAATFLGAHHDYITLDVFKFEVEETVGIGGAQVPEIYSSAPYQQPKRQHSGVNFGDHLDRSIFQRVFACSFFFSTMTPLSKKGIVRGLCPAWYGCEYDVEPTISCTSRHGSDKYKTRFDFKGCNDPAGEGIDDVEEHYQDINLTIEDSGNVTDISYIYKRKSRFSDILHKARFTLTSVDRKEVTESHARN